MAQADADNGIVGREFHVEVRVSDKITKVVVEAMDAKTSRRNEFGYCPARCAYEHVRIKFPDGGKKTRLAFWRLLDEYQAQGKDELVCSESTKDGA